MAKLPVMTLEHLALQLYIHLRIVRHKLHIHLRIKGHSLGHIDSHDQYEMSQMKVISVCIFI